jgi:hypothetical protein
VPVFPTDVSSHVMDSLPNPSESERPFSPLEEPVLPALGRRGGGRGMERNGLPMLCAREPCHWPRRSQDSKARYHWPWAVGAGAVGTVGERDGTGNEREGGGVFLPQTFADIYHTGVFQKNVVCS